MVANEDPQSISFRPTKRIFIKSFTRDIELNEAILDLVDNSIDGYFRLKKKKPVKIRLNFNKNMFKITDNGSGIPIDRTYNDIFRIGRVHESESSRLGVFGVGLKRAIFKIGEDILIESDDGNDYFAIQIDKKWLDKDDIWEIEKFSKFGKSKGKPFFRITIKKIFPGVADDLKSKPFEDKLIEKTKEIHSIILYKEKIDIIVNQKKIIPLYFEFLYDKKRDFSVFRKKYNYGEVKAEVIAGLSKEGLKRGSDVERVYGWYIFCNDRSIIQNDISSDTGFSDDSEGRYHYPQDARILGLAFLWSKDPDKLPWETTKNGVDLSNKIYRELRREMQKVTKRLIRFTRAIYQVKDPETGEAIGKSIFDKVNCKNWDKIPKGQIESYPDIKGELIKKIPKTRISYTVEKDRIKAVKQEMENTALSNKDVGIKTFNFYYKIKKIGEEE